MTRKHIHRLARSPFKKLTYKLGDHKINKMITVRYLNFQNEKCLLLPAPVRLKLNVQISMCRIWDTQVGRTNMLWKQVPAISRTSSNVINDQNLNEIYRARQIYERGKFSPTGFFSEKSFFKAKKIVIQIEYLGILLPSRAFRAEDAVSASVNWINACKEACHKSIATSESLKPQQVFLAVIESSNFKTNQIQCFLTWKPAAFSKVAILCTNPKAENTWNKFGLIVTSQHTIILVRQMTVNQGENQSVNKLAAIKYQQIRSKCRKRPVHISVKIDLRKEYDAHDNISKLSPINESNKKHPHLWFNCSMNSDSSTRNLAGCYSSKKRNYNDIITIYMNTYRAFFCCADVSLNHLGEQ